MAQEPGGILSERNVSCGWKPAQGDGEDGDQEHADDENRHGKTHQGSRGGNRVGQAAAAARGEHPEGDARGRREERGRYHELQRPGQPVNEVACYWAVVHERAPEVSSTYPLQARQILQPERLVQAEL